MGLENIDPLEELKRIGEQVESATYLAALKPIYFRLQEIIRAFPDDFDVQFTGDEIKQRLMARGALLKQQEISPPPLPTSSLDTVAPSPTAPLEPATMPAAPLSLSSPLFDPAPQQQPPPALAVTPEHPPQPPTGPPPRPTLNWNRAVVIGPIAGLLVALALIFLVVHQTRERNANNVAARQPAAVSLTLQPQAQSVRLLTDLTQGKVVVDDRPPVDLQDGQLVFDKVAPGTHTVKVAGQNGDASFSFEIVDARLPAVAGPVHARNMIAVLVASFGKRARVVTNAGPWRLVVNGQPQGGVGPAGTDLTGFQLGVNEIVVGEGQDQRNMSERFGAAPMLTAFLKSDVNAGTLIVSTGQDEVRVFLNDREYRRRTQRGQLRVQTIGKVTVRVAKSGFQDAPAQAVEVKKGVEVRLQFDLKPQPQFSSLQIRGAMAGSEVLVDQKDAGAVGPDGSFSLSAIQPGDHTIELRREQYLPKRLQRSFHAGQAVVLAGADVVLAAANGTIRLTRNPESATIIYRRGDETESHEARENQIELPPGSYAFSASAPGFTEFTIRVQLAAGESRTVDFALVRERPAAPPPVAARGMAEFEDAQSWKKDGDGWVHKGGGFVPYKLPPKGVFTFTVQLLKGGSVFRAGQIRWCFQYLDSKNYLLYEMDRKNFWAGVIEKGKRLERVKAPHNLGNQKTFTIQIEVAPDRLVQEVRVGDEWKVLDTFVEAGRDFTQGKFGFLIQGNDEIAVSDFKFLPK